MATHPNLLDADNSVLLVVDIQGRLTAAMSAVAAEQMLNHGRRLLEAARLLQVPVLLTEQYPQGLGPTQSEIGDYLPDATRIFG